MYGLCGYRLLHSACKEVCHIIVFMCTSFGSLLQKAVATMNSGGRKAHPLNPHPQGAIMQDTVGDWKGIFPNSYVKVGMDFRVCVCVRMFIHVCVCGTSLVPGAARREKRAPAVHCSRMREVSMVTCILLRYTNITTNFSLPAERPHGRAMLLARIIWMDLESEIISL